MDRLDTLALFVRSVETGSFSAAAREAGTTQSAVSKRIAALEARLGTGLIRRTTRSLSLTEDGRTYYEDCRRILDAVAQSETRIGRQRTSPGGAADSRLRGLHRRFIPQGSVHGGFGGAIARSYRTDAGKAFPPCAADG